MDIRQAFGLSLRTFRNKTGVTQEDFSTVSSRTYISQLERGHKSPTLEKLEDLAVPLQVHPVSLITLAYLRLDTAKDLDALLDQVRREVQSIM